MNRKEWLAITLVAVSLISATSETLFYWFGVGAIPVSASLGRFLYPLLLVLWVVADSKDYPQIEKPFEFGFLAYLFWLPYLPYYFWRTRGAFGMVVLSGFLILPLLGWFMQMGVYLVHEQLGRFII